MNTFERVSKWNARAGNVPEAVGSDEYFLSLWNQAERVREELNELYEAIAKRDIEGVVDAGLDLDVVVAGVNYLSKCDYAGGIDAVLSNNDLKIFTDRQEAEKVADYYAAQNVEVYIKHWFNGHTDVMYYSVRRKSDNKILKYEDFPSVDLTSFVPQQEIAYYTLAKDSETELSDYAKTFQTLTLADIVDDEGRAAMQSIMEQAGQDSVRLVVKVPDFEILRIEHFI